jgi:hypothetical protein
MQSTGDRPESVTGAQQNTTAQLNEVAGKFNKTALNLIQKEQ